MADLDSLANILNAASDIYFKHKSLDLVQSREAQNQANFIVSNMIREEENEKNRMVTVLNSSLARNERRNAELNKSFDLLSSKYERLTGDVIGVNPLEKTNEAVNILDTMKGGSINALNNEIKNLENENRVMEKDIFTLNTRLAEIDDMKAYISGGAGGYTGGIDPMAYDLDDFSYQGYIEDRGIESQPWLESAYRDPTQKELLDLNAKVAQIEYRKALTAGRPDASNKYFETLHIRSDDPAGWQPWKTSAANLAQYDASEMGNEDAIAARKRASREKAEISISSDYTGWLKVKNRMELVHPSLGIEDLETISLQGAGKNYIFYRDHPKYPGSLKKIELKESQTKTLKAIAKLYNDWKDVAFEEMYNAHYQLKTRQGIMGTGVELQPFVAKAFNDYNALKKENPTEAMRLARRFQNITGIDVSKEAEVKQFNDAVSTEGMVALKDKSVVNNISADWGTDQMLLTSYYVDSLENNPSDPKDYFMRNYGEFYKQMINEYGRDRIISSLKSMGTP